MFRPLLKGALPGEDWTWKGFTVTQYINDGGMYRYDRQKVSPTKIHCTMCLEMLPQFVKNCTNHDNQEACNFGNEIFSANLHGALFVVRGFIRWRREHVSVESSNGASDDNAVRLDTLLRILKPSKKTISFSVEIPSQLLLTMKVFQPERIGTWTSWHY